MDDKYIATEENGNLIFIESQEVITRDTSYDNIDNSFIYKDKGDKYDYLVSVGLGVIGGLIDVFLVGNPNNSILGEITDNQYNEIVIKFAKMLKGDGTIYDIKTAKEYLERNAKVNYDQSIGNSASEVLNITPSNHHMKSIAHSPDIIGLFFSIINQFTSTSSFLSKGKYISMNTDDFELQGSNIVSKLYCGFINWFKHLMSDVAGSSKSKNRGAGLVMPFYELLNLAEFGNFNISQKSYTIADLAVKVYEYGYDIRFGTTMSIPVLVTNLCIKFFWSIRRLLQYKVTIKEVLPSIKNEDLRTMLLIGNSTMCVIDGIDAGIKSKGNIIVFVTNLNMIGWLKLVKLVIKHFMIKSNHIGIEETIELMYQIDENISEYLEKLKTLDIDKYKSEIRMYAEWNKKIDNINDEKQFNLLLFEAYNIFNITKPWKGDFNDFMQNKNNVLIFE